MNTLLKFGRGFNLGLVGLLLASALAGCGGYVAPSGPNGYDASKSANGSWRQALLRVAPRSAGCFVASYPAMSWSSVACSKPSKVWIPPYRRASNSYARRAMVAGGGTDYILSTNSRLISSATGSFPTVSGVTGVSSSGGSNCGSLCGQNAYSLQLNTNFFPTTACNGQTNCKGWEQFVFQNPYALRYPASMFIEYWLVATSGSIQCPSGKGWISEPPYGCYQNSSQGTFNGANYMINVWLSKIAVTGTVSSSYDEVYVAIGSNLYALGGSDAILGSSSQWTDANFDVIGVCCASEAVFNSGATITVDLEADDGVLTPPSCFQGSTTGESNNLSLVTAPAATEREYPSIVFKESNLAGGAGSCNVAAGTGIPPTPVPTPLPTIPIP